MVTVVVIAAIADQSLVCAAFIAGIPVPYVFMVFPWIALVHYYFIVMVPVEIAVPWW